MFEKLKELSAAVDEKAEFPAEGLKIIAEAGHFEKTSLTENMWTVFDAAKSCGSTAACAAVILAAAAVAEKAHKAVRSAAAEGQPVSLCIGDFKYENGVLSGSCAHAPFAGFAPYYVAVSGDESYLVPSTAMGITVGKKDDKLGLRGMTTAKLSFKDTPALALGITDARARLWALMAAVCTGLALSGADEARDHAYMRVQFKKRITEFENTRRVLADCYTASQTGGALLEKCVRAGDNHDPRFAELAAMSKLHCCRSAVDELRRCIQVMSGQGYMRDFPVEVKYRDAKTCESFFGTPAELGFFVADCRGVN